MSELNKENRLNKQSLINTQGLGSLFLCTWNLGKYKPWKIWCGGGGGGERAKNMRLKTFEKDNVASAD